MPQHIPLKKLFDHQQGLRSDEFQTIENHLADCEHCTENMTLFSPHRRAQETKLASAHQREPANGKQADEREDGCPPPELIDRFISNSLPKRQQREVEKHLAICDACRRQLIAVFQASFAPVSEEEKKLLEALPPFEISAHVNAIKKLMPKKPGVLDVIRQWPGRLELPVPAFGIPRPALALALVLAMGLIGKWWAWPAYQYYFLVSQSESQLEEQYKIYYRDMPRPSLGYLSSEIAEPMGPEEEKQTIDALLKKALHYKPNSETARLRLAQYFLFQKMEGSADSLLKLLEAASPPNAAVLNDRGIWLFNRKEFGLAAAAFQRAFDLNPRLDETLYNLAIAQTQLGDTTGARTSWKKYIGLKNIKAEWRNAARTQLQELEQGLRK
jgi:tetratricopeptide (TPR) repeat protein